MVPAPGLSGRISALRSGHLSIGVELAGCARDADGVSVGRRLPLQITGGAPTRCGQSCDGRFTAPQQLLPLADLLARIAIALSGWFLHVRRACARAIKPRPGDERGGLGMLKVVAGRLFGIEVRGREWIGGG